MTLMLFFLQARIKKSGSSTPELADGFGEEQSRAERDSYQALRGRGSPQGWPGPWLGADSVWVRGRGDASDPALVHK